VLLYITHKAHGDVATLGHPFSNYVHCCLIGTWTLEEAAIPSFWGREEERGKGRRVRG
jgi:hypothetical protein